MLYAVSIKKKVVCSSTAYETYKKPFVASSRLQKKKKIVILIFFYRHSYRIQLRSEKNIFRQS